MAFDRDRRNRGRSFGRRDDRSGRFDRPREMTKVTCSNCGKETEVPFKPTGDRPVYCRDCFAKMGGGERRRDNRDSRPPFRGSDNNAQLSEINAKLDQLIKLLTPGSASLTTSKVEEKPIEQTPEKKEVIKKTRSKISGREKAVKKVLETPVEAPNEDKV